MKAEESVDREGKGAVLSIRHGSLLEFQIHGVPGGITGFCVGSLPKDYIIVQVPQISNIQGKISEGDTAHFDYRFGSHAYSFESTVKGVFGEKEFKLIFFSYPTAVIDHSMRRNERIVSYLPAAITLEDSVHEGIILDISISGCKFRSNTGMPRDVDIEDNVTVSCHFTGLTECQRIRGVVRSFALDRNRLQIGIEFMSLDDHTLVNVSRYIQNVLESRPESGN